MNIFTFAALIALCALLPVASAGAIFWGALADGRRITRGEPPRRAVDLARGFFIRGRYA
jgi:hypothetical protein